MQTTVSWKQVSAFRLARHQLLERAPAGELVSVAGEMAGVQAQLLTAAQTGLWARLAGLQVTEIENALAQGSLVKAACMRRTLFLVPGRNLAVFVRGAARRAEKEVRWALGKGVPRRTVEAAIEATLSVLDEPLSRNEIAGRVSRKLGVQTGEHQGGGWGSRRRLAAVPVGNLVYPVVDLLHLVGARGVVCYGPYRGSEPTFVRADAWVPGYRDIRREQAEDLLLRKYLQAFGPATTADFALWAGINLGEAREIWQRSQPALAPVTVEGWQAGILQEDLEVLARSKLEAPVTRLLPYFDTFLLGHRERDHLLAPQHRSQVYRPQGWIAPVVLADGRVAAVWEQAREGDRLLVQVRKLSPLTRQTVSGIRREAQDLGRFLGAAKVDVRIG